MNEERQQRIKLLLDRAEVLLARSQAYSNPNAPRWRRVLNAYRRAMILRRAGAMMDEVSALNGRPRPAEKWLGMGRTGWLVMQFGFGVLNAWSGIDSAMKGKWFLAAVSFVCVIVTAHWRLPYAPPRVR
jgi:hypothetical protein